jgi:hypothetical protein
MRILLTITIGLVLDLCLASTPVLIRGRGTVTSQPLVGVGSEAVASSITVTSSLEETADPIRFAVKLLEELTERIRASSASLRGGYDHCISEHVSDEFRRIGRYLAIAPHLQTEAGQTERVVLRELAPPKSARSLPVMRMDVVSLELRSLISALKADVSERPADSSVSGESDITVESDQVVSGSTVAPFTAAHDGEFLLFEMDP